MKNIGGGVRGAIGWEWLLYRLEVIFPVVYLSLVLTHSFALTLISAPRFVTPFQARNLNKKAETAERHRDFEVWNLTSILSSSNEMHFHFVPAFEGTKLSFRFIADETKASTILKKYPKNSVNVKYRKPLRPIELISMDVAVQRLWYQNFGAFLR